MDQATAKSSPEVTLEDIEFEEVTHPDLDEIMAFYARQSHHPTQSREKLKRMLDNTFCIVTGRHQGRLIGIARGVTDGVRGRLAECKLDPRYQGPACITRLAGRIEHDASGIAREMATRVIDAMRGSGVERVEAIAYGTEVDFCEELGFKRLPGVVALELAFA